MQAVRTSNRLARRVQFTNHAGETPRQMVQTFVSGTRDTTGPMGFVASGRELSWDEPTPVMGIPALADTKS